MAIKNEPIKKGKYWTNILSEVTGESVNYEETLTWYDGSPMDDSKCDGVIYRKLPTSVGGGYVVRSGFPEKRAVDVDWFGAKIDTDISDNLQAAINSPAKVINIGSGSYIVSKTINVPANKTLVGSGQTIIQITGADEDGILFENEGLEELPLLSADITKNNKTISFVTAPDLAVGDIFFVRDNTDSSYSQFRSYYKKGEFFEVLSVSGQNVTVTNFPYDTYSANNANLIIRKVVSPPNGGLSGISINAEGSTVNSPVTVKFAKNFNVDNVEIVEGRSRCIGIANSFGVTVNNLRASKLSNGGLGTDYGLMISNSQNVLVGDCHIISVRHAVAMGGSNQIGDVICRNIKVSNSILRGTSITHAVDSHGNCEHIEYTGCTVWGAILRGNHIKFTNNTVFSNTNAIVLGEMSGFDYNIVDNVINSVTQGSISGGSILDVGGTGIAFNEMTLAGGMLNFSGNKIYAEPSVTNSTLISIQNRGADQEMDVAVIGNTVFVKPVEGQGSRANQFLLCQNYLATSNRAFSSVTVVGNSAYGGVHVRNSNKTHIDGNTLMRSSSYGIFVSVNEATQPNILLKITNNTIARTGWTSIAVTGLSSNLIGNAIIRDNMMDENNLASSSPYKNFIKVEYVDKVWISGNVGTTPHTSQTDKINIGNVGEARVFNNDIEGNGTILQPFTELNTNPVMDLSMYGYRVDSGGDFNSVGYFPVVLHSDALNAPPTIDGISRWWTYKQKIDNIDRHFQIAFSNAATVGASSVIAIRTLNPALGPGQYTPWTVLGSPASISTKGLVNQSASQTNISQADLATIATPDATDEASAITLVNAIKVFINDNAIPLINATKASQNTELTNQRTAGQQAT